MNRKTVVFLILGISILTRISWAEDTTFSGNFLVPETQTGFVGEEYEVLVGQKLQRGAENFFTGPMEIFQGIKAESARRKSEYLPTGVETFFIGTMRGFGHAIERSAVGLFEMVTCVYPQKPILPELNEWLY